MGKYQLFVNVRLSQSDRGGGLDIVESAEIEAETFLEIAGVLGEFHRLSERIKQERGATS